MTLVFSMSIVDESKRFSSYWLTVPDPLRQCDSLVVRASGGSVRATTESSTKFMKDDSSTLPSA